MEEKERRWLVSIIPREGTQWPHETTAEDWGANAAASLKQIILRYRLDGIDVDFEGAGADPEVFTTAMCSLFYHLKEMLPGAIVTTAFYGNPDANVQTIPLYQKLQEECDERIDLYLYQDYANWDPSVSSNVKHIGQMGKLFGWEKFLWGVGVGGSQNGRWRWWPSMAPRETGTTIMQALQAPGVNYADSRGKQPSDRLGFVLQKQQVIQSRLLMRRQMWQLQKISTTMKRLKERC